MMLGRINVFSRSIVLALLVTSSVQAADLVLPVTPPLQLDEPSVGKAISPLKRDQRAPFTGILFSPEAAADITVRLNSLDERIQIEIEHANEICKANSDHDKAKLEIDLNAEHQSSEVKLNAAKRVNDALLIRIDDLEKNQPNVTFWTVGGMVVGIGITTLVAFVLK